MPQRIRISVKDLPQPFAAEAKARLIASKLLAGMGTGSTCRVDLIGDGVGSIRQVSLELQLGWAFIHSTCADAGQGGLFEGAFKDAVSQLGRLGLWHPSVAPSAD